VNVMFVDKMAWLSRLATASLLALIPQASLAKCEGRWADIWGAMPQLTEYSNLPAPPYVRPPPFSGSIVPS